jgi:hypothetical protein
VVERKLLLSLAHSQRAGGCSVIESNPPDLNTSMTERSGDSDSSRYDSYIYELADTTYALCPSGNNPETFRLYEVTKYYLVLFFNC